mmetsp:Transcript_21292/g.49997  ORF Transcript_21292/g.49997 Transcript_21292/m.49997 type:complete len:229 (-) Transcript_21292:557-1243(-)
MGLERARRAIVAHPGIGLTKTGIGWSLGRRLQFDNEFRVAVDIPSIGHLRNISTLVLFPYILASLLALFLARTRQADIAKSINKQAVGSAHGIQRRIFNVEGETLPIASSGRFGGLTAHPLVILPVLDLAVPPAVERDFALRTAEALGDDCRAICANIPRLSRLLRLRDQNRVEQRLVELSLPCRLAEHRRSPLELLASEFDLLERCSCHFHETSVMSTTSQEGRRHV